MAESLESLTAVFLEESHRWDSTAILRCEIADDGGRKISVDHIADLDDKLVTIKVFECEEGEFTPGLPFTFYGNWQTYTPKKNYSDPRKRPIPEQQFHAKKWRKVRPYDKQGVIKWLIQAPGIKHGIALKLWNAYGADAIQRVKDEPEAVAGEISSGFTIERAKMAAAHFKQNETMEAAFVDLGSLLDGRGFPHSLSKKLCRDYGGDAAQAVKKNPWLLLQYKSTGVSRVDKLYLDLGGNPSAIKRQTIILWKCLLDAGNATGDTWQREEAAKQMLKDRIAGAEVKFRKAMELGARSGMIATRWEGISECWLAEGRRANQESYIVRRVASMLQEKCEWPSLDGMVLSDHQKEKVLDLFSRRCPLIILGGSPGTGKTHVASQIVAALQKDETGLYNIGAGCPTGKAAVRLSEVLQNYNLSLRATTEHSMLGVATTPEIDGWGFAHDEKNPLDFMVLLLDEQSMKDNSLMCAIFRAAAEGTRIILIGDILQLPPIGPGAPLRDMIAAGVPYAELTEIRRNSGTVVRACEAIREGTFSSFRFDEQFQLEPRAEDPDSPRNAKIILTKNNADSVEKIVAALHGLRGKSMPVNPRDYHGPRRLIDVVWDTQIIVATNGVRQGKSELSRFEINKRLQNELNPTGKTFPGSPFRNGEKILNFKNGYMPIVEEDSPYFDPAANLTDLDEAGEKVRVYNGEIARVIDQEEKVIYARAECPLRIFKIPRGKAEENGEDSGDEEKTKTGCSFDLGYACTAHKSQGSQFPIVLFGIDESPGARMVLSREAVYTILSRMTYFVGLFGKRAVLDGFCKRLALAPRRTFLRESILEMVSELEASRK